MTKWRRMHSNFISQTPEASSKKWYNWTSNRSRCRDSGIKHHVVFLSKYGHHKNDHRANDLWQILNNRALGSISFVETNSKDKCVFDAFKVRGCLSPRSSCLCFVATSQHAWKTCKCSCLCTSGWRLGCTQHLFANADTESMFVRPNANVALLSLYLCGRTRYSTPFWGHNLTDMSMITLFLKEFCIQMLPSSHCFTK